MLTWKPGPKEEGCTYHDRGTERFGDESIVVDVFVMPRIAHRRPLAITVGRYLNESSTAKRQWEIDDPNESEGVAGKVALLFQEIGLSESHASRLGNEVHYLLKAKSRHIASTLRAIESAS